jgi:Mrp family chromosome partitioning ATPase
VVLVDANLRTPCQHLALDIPRLEGLADVLAGECSLTAAVVAGIDGGLAVLPSGAPHDSPPHLLSHSAFHSLISALQAEFDWVIMDGPPVTGYPDSASLAAAAGGAILVLQAERTRWEVAEEARRVLENSGVSILGAVLNRRRYHIPDLIYRKL